MCSYIAFALRKKSLLIVATIATKAYVPCNPVLVDVTEMHASGTDMGGGGGGGGGGEGESGRGREGGGGGRGEGWGGEEGGGACPSRCTFVLSTPIKCIVAHHHFSKS